VADTNDPHAGQPVLQAGGDLAGARAAMIMLHGRGANASDILSLAELFERDGIAYLAPEAANNAWYPYPFLAPVERNQPSLSSALKVVAGLLARIGEEGMPAERVVILGFSQGACLGLEFAARNPRRYGGVVALSGGLIGAEIKPDDYAGSLEGTPVFLGCSDVDPHIPLRRVNESTAVMTKLGGEVTERIYPGMDHSINEDEVAHVREILSNAIGEDY
jgi:phospholipase/carboxylesterase